MCNRNVLMYKRPVIKPFASLLPTTFVAVLMTNLMFPLLVTFMILLLDCFFPVQR